MASNPGMDRRAIVFGATGAIGSAICEQLHAEGYEVTGIARQSTERPYPILSWNPFLDPPPFKMGCKPFDALIWAQGMNLNDAIETFELGQHEEMYRANVTYILLTLNHLIKLDCLSKPSRLCIISSIWQNIARQNKLSYMVTKSALQGVVQSLMLDLGKQGHLINAVLPGALDTKMTRSNLNQDQINRLELMTPLQSLPELSDVSHLVSFLCSDKNSGITGQFIHADRGFTYARII
ncbi:SDR family oxidoreductase [Methylovorus glucosotrophus]|uniref:SDR family oxidoreductase n=1 Tax=Methylovorus glucosotrophus TaxID=266009 RepID=UPI001FD01341|nr:SDR family oxidoreductase [Methylovorus glucosotrophus]